MNTLRFHVNDELIEASDVSPTTTLLGYLREHLGLTGTKEGCAEGDCGACSVAIIDPDAEAGPAFRAINACLVLLPMVHGKHIYTVEALHGAKAPHPVQEALVDRLASQCGYCTPGVAMSLLEACYRRDLDEDWKLDDQLAGNLCRCTGYRPIVEAAKSVAGKIPDDALKRALYERHNAPADLTYEHGGQRWFTPTRFEELFDILEAHPEARFVAGGTDLALDITKRFAKPPLLVSLEGLDPLRRLQQDDDAWHIGAAVSLANLEAAAREVLPALERMLRFFGARQIKNRGTIGGNLCSASPIADLPPILLAVGAHVTLRSREGTRQLPLSEFFLGYRETALRPGEILDSVHIAPLPAGTRVASYKVSKRQELDISTVSAGLLVVVDDRGTVTQARFGYGGMAATPALAPQAQAAVVGRTWNEPSVKDATQALMHDFEPISDHRGSAWYRRAVAANLLTGFFHETQREPSPRLPHRPTATVMPETKS